VNVSFAQDDHQCKKAEQLLGVAVTGILFDVYERYYTVFTEEGAVIKLGIWFGSTPMSVIETWPRLLQVQ